MQYSGTIHFQNNVSESSWKAILDTFNLESTHEAEMFAPMIGEYVTVADPPNLLAFAIDSTGQRTGLIRCSRMFFDGGVGDTAEISFQGSGDEFEATIKGISDHVSGELTLSDTESD